MSVYELSYQKKENYPYCSMMIVADDEKAVENYAIDKGYTWFAFSEIDTATVDENNRKNMPCIDLTPVDEKTAQMDAIHAEIMQEHDERVEKTFAIANAFNQSTAILRLLYTLKASALLEGKKPGENNSNTPLCSYGAGYGALPYYEGGVGSNCFWSILKNCGYSTKYIDAGKYSTVYVINKKEG